MKNDSPVLKTFPIKMFYPRVKSTGKVNLTRIKGTIRTIKEFLKDKTKFGTYGKCYQVPINTILTT